MFKPHGLFLYKNRPARLLQAGDRLEIELEGGETVRVRPKDVVLLHPGPLSSLRDLRAQPGEVQAAWEVLAGEQTDLAGLAELVYGAYTPITAWAAWQLVAEGLYFEGNVDAIRARTPEEVARRQREREQVKAHQQAWQGFLARARQGAFLPEDRAFLRDVEDLAYGRSQRSAVMRELGRAETPDNAHALLLDWGVWGPADNPYPARQGIALKQPDLPVPALEEEARRDLTYLEAYAIDDEETDTPDDAISLELTPGGQRVWVHVADAAALVPPDSPLDLDARSRGETLHLPEGAIHLLPWEVTLQLGLGLQDISPALSFGMDFNDQGEVTGFEIIPSRVRVTRLSYQEAEGRLESEPFRQLDRLAGAARVLRQVNGAVMIDFPEVKFHIEDGRVDLRPLPPLRSRAMVEEMMIQAGAEAARFARERGLSLAFSQQDVLETSERPRELSGMFALRRLLKRSHYSTVLGPHGGLGVPAYTQVTSPLRRYLDLVGHQQIRAYLAGRPLLSEAELLERIGSLETAIGPLRQAEWLSEKHWTLVFLLQHPGWRGEGILVEKRGATGTAIIPELALEVRVHLKGDWPLDQTVPLALAGVDLAQREARLRLAD